MEKLQIIFLGRFHFLKLGIIIWILLSNLNLLGQGRTDTPTEIYSSIKEASFDGFRGYISDTCSLEWKLPPPGDQGQIGACVAFTLGYAIKSFQERDGKYINADGSLNNFKIFSPAFLHNYSKGSNMFSMLELLIKKGIVTSNLYPYERVLKYPYSLDYSDTLISIDKYLDSANSYKIKSYEKFSPPFNVDSLKRFIFEESPIALGFLIDSSLLTDGRKFFFDGEDKNGKKFIWDGKLKGKTIGHAVTIIGYDDSDSCLKIMNSWGPWWGNKGFFWIPYKALMNKIDVYAGENKIHEKYVFSEAYVIYDEIK